MWLLTLFFLSSIYANNIVSNEMRTDIPMHTYFPHHPNYSLPLGDEISILYGISNQLENLLTCESLSLQLHLNQGRITQQLLNTTFDVPVQLKSHEEMAFAYTFTIDGNTQPEESILQTTFQCSMNNMSYALKGQNQTITLIERLSIVNINLFMFYSTASNALLFFAFLCYRGMRGIVKTVQRFSTGTVTEKEDWLVGLKTKVPTEKKKMNKKMKQ